MRKSYIREKRTLCGDTYQAVGIYPVTDQEHRQRGKKRKESDKGQKSRNKAASLRRRLRKVLANFDQNGFYLTATYEDAYLPEDEEGCWRDVRNYARRVQRRAGDLAEVDAVGHAQRRGRAAAHAWLCPVPGAE